MTAGMLEFIAVPSLPSAEAETLGAALAVIDPWRTLGYAAPALARGLESTHPDLTRFLAVRDGATEGLFSVRQPWLRGAYIEIFAVLPQAQGRGVGRAALAWIESHYQGRTANLWLLVSGFNGRARTFYERHGFQPIGIIPDLVAAGQDEVLMRKRLAPVLA
jgi:diamine N-acetyltransferase